MKIINLHVENIKRIEVIDITPQKNAVILEGRNEQGKSSALDSIAMLLGGKKLIPKMPIREGQKEGKIEGDLGEVKVSRWWTEAGKDYLKIEQKDGMRPTSPQAWLDARIGNLSFDPLDFIRKVEKDPKAAVEELRKISGLDTAKIDDEIAKVFEERKIAKQKLELFKGEVAGYAEVPDKVEAPDRMIDDVQKERSLLLDQNNKSEMARHRLSQFKDELARLKADRDKLLVQIQQIDRRTVEINDAEAELKELAAKEPVDLTPLDHEIRAINAFAGMQERIEIKAQVQKKFSDQQAVVDKLEDAIKTLRDTREGKVKEAKMPIEGLELRDEGIFYKGRPIEQSSQSEKIRIGMAIAMANDPEIEIVLIRDGSLLDDDSMAEVVSIAEEKGFQVWIERVASKKSGGDTVFIEEGKVSEGVPAALDPDVNDTQTSLL